MSETFQVITVPSDDKRKQEQEKTEARRILEQVLDEAVSGEIAHMIFEGETIRVDDLCLAEALNPDQKRGALYFSNMVQNRDGSFKRGGQSLSARILLEAVLLPERYKHGKDLLLQSVHLKEIHKALVALSYRQTEPFWGYMNQAGQPWSHLKGDGWRYAIISWGYHARENLNEQGFLDDDHLQSPDAFYQYVRELADRVKTYLSEQGQWIPSPNVNDQWFQAQLSAAITYCKLQLKAEKAGRRAQAAQEAWRAAGTTAPPPANVDKGSGGAVDGVPIRASGNPQTTQPDGAQAEGLGCFKQNLREQQISALQALASSFDLGRELTPEEIKELLNSSNSSMDLLKLIAQEKAKKGSGASDSLEELRKRQQAEWERMKTEQAQKRVELEAQIAAARDRAKAEYEKGMAELEERERQYQEQQEQARRKQAAAPGAGGAPESGSTNQYDVGVLQAEEDVGRLLYEQYQLAFLELAGQSPAGATRQYEAMTEADRMRLLYSGQFMKQYGQAAEEYLNSGRESSFSRRDILQMLLSVPLASRMLAHNLVMTAQQASLRGSEILTESLQDFLLNQMKLPYDLAQIHAKKIAATYLKNPGQAEHSLPSMLTDSQLAPYVREAAISARNNLVAQAMAAAR